MRARVRDVVKAWSKAAAAVGDCLAKQIERELEPAVPPNAPTSGEPPAPDAAQSAAPANAPDQERNPSYDEVKKLNLLLKEMQICSHQIAPTLRIIEKADLDASLSERAYQPEILERELKLHADIDKRIEKTIARLIGLKEYKRMYTPKLVNATPAAATSGVPGSQASPVTTPSGMLP